MRSSLSLSSVFFYSISNKQINLDLYEIESALIPQWRWR